MTEVWVIDSNCLIHIGAMAPPNFVSDLQLIIDKNSTNFFVTPGVNDEVRNVRFQRWDGKPNLLDQMSEILITISVEDQEIKQLASKIGEKSSPQDVDLSLMTLAKNMSQEGKKVTLVSDDYKMTTASDKVNLNFETCPPSTFLQRLAGYGSRGLRSRMRSLSRRVRAAEMRYAISRAGQYDIQAKLTWMVESLLTSKVQSTEESTGNQTTDERKLVSALIRAIRGEKVKKSLLNSLGKLPEICAPVCRLDDHLSSLSTDDSLENIVQKYDASAEILSEVLEKTGVELAPFGEEMAELAHRAMSGYLYRMESALGVMARMSGNLSLSRLHLSRALHLATLIDDISAEMRAMHQLGLLSLANSNWKRAANLFETSDRQAQMIGTSRLPPLILGGIARHLNSDLELAISHIKAAEPLVRMNKDQAAVELTTIGNSLLAIDCPGLAIEILDEAMECAIETSQEISLDLLAELLLLANAAILGDEKKQYDGLRQLLDGLNQIPEDSLDKFQQRIARIDEKKDELSKPLDDTWTEWQQSTRLLQDEETLTVLRIDRDDEGQELIISHHNEIGAIGIWLPKGGSKAASGNQIKIQNSRIKIVKPTDLLKEIHSIRGIVAIENPEGLSFIVKTDEITRED
ncbi:MAG: hypothetical protein QGI21_04415 [Candidatus Poseidoniaceae archaeon]|nr:hypothetical protein [Candidatus Poseidoniaceae archaeon]